MSAGDRWTLGAVSQGELHPDAEAIVTWAAAKLGPHLPDGTREEREDEPSSPPGGGDGGGPSGAAELGIPIWWARNPRRN